MPEHVKTELADPRFRERRAELLAREKGSNLVGGDNLAQNLQKMTNFLGKSNDDVSISDKIAFEKEKAKEKQKVIWDGHKGSVALANAKMQAISEHQPPPPSGPPPVGPLRKVCLCLNIRRQHHLKIYQTLKDKKQLILMRYF
jgi:hypothetical protein